MFKVSRLTDYGVVLLHYLAKERGQAGMVFSARSLANESHLPLPTVCKLLKILAKHKIVDAKRGASGGYELLMKPSDISLLDLIEVFEGKQSVTSCIDATNHQCQIPTTCPQKGTWVLVNETIRRVLKNITLLDLIDAQSVPNNSAGRML